MNTNYQKQLETILPAIPKGSPLLLHSCCAPCSSYVLEYLSHWFSITVFYYNPNISEKEEYTHRAEEQMRLIREMPTEYPVAFLSGKYEPSVYFDAVKGFENEVEGGARCKRCFALRLRRAAEAAKRGNFPYFTTTLTISPLKDAALINEIGAAAAEEYGLTWLPSDFKKKDGFKRSIELSARYGLYRQDYCGCIYSRR